MGAVRFHETGVDRDLRERLTLVLGARRPVSPEEIASWTDADKHVVQGWLETATKLFRQGRDDYPVRPRVLLGCRALGHCAMADRGCKSPKGTLLPLVGKSSSPRGYRNYCVECYSKMAAETRARVGRPPRKAGG